MKPEEMNIAIAEHLGFRWELLNGNTVSILTSYANGSYDVSGGKYGWNDTGRWDYANQTCFSAAGFAMSIGGVPNYHGDLNACHEIEEALDERLCQEYNDWLEAGNPSPPGIMKPVKFWSWHYTAAQRAEAFLRTVGKFTE